MATLLSVSSFSVAALAEPQGEVQNESDWKLVWSDEFDGTKLDTSKWGYDIGNCLVDGGGNKIADGWGNSELEYYTNSNKNVYLEGGNLVIQANKEKSPKQFGNSCDYTSGKVITKGKFSKKYGRIDVRAKLPTGSGIWPAIWMLPEKNVYGGWAASGEIDIMEARGSKPQTLCGTLHYGAVWPNNKYSSNDFTFDYEGDDSIADFHVYSIEWKEGEMKWYVDGKLYQTQNKWSTTGAPFPAPFDQEFYLILNLAVGGHFDGNPTANTKFPAKMVIDYARVYDPK